MTSQTGFETYGPYATSVADKYGIPESVFLNQINQESGFRTGLTSSKGALGIAQILPTTARNPGYGVSSVDPNDPYAAIDFMGQYDAAMYARTGSITGMLEGYNAGLGHLSAGSPYAKSVLGGPFSGGSPPTGTAPAPSSGGGNPFSNWLVGPFNDWWNSLVGGANSTEAGASAIVSAITGKTVNGVTPDQGKTAIGKTTGTDQISKGINDFTTKLFGAQTWQAVAVAVLGLVLILGALFWLANSGKAQAYIQAAKTGGALA